MKIKQFLTKTVAICICALMLVSNASAAITTERVIVNGVANLKVTINGLDTDKAASVVAFDSGAVTNAAWTGNGISFSDARYLNQKNSGAMGTAVFTFGQKAEGADKIDIFANNAGRTHLDVQVKSNVFIKDKLNITGDASYVYNAVAKSFTALTADEMKTFFIEKGFSVKLQEIGKTALQDITINVSNAANFSFAIKSSAKNVHTVEVTYNPGTSAEEAIKAETTIVVTEKQPATAITVTGITAAQRSIKHYVDDVDSFIFTSVFAEEKINAIPNFKVEATRATGADDVTADVKYDFTAGANNTYTVAVKYENNSSSIVTAPETFTIEIIKNMITSADVTTTNLSKDVSAADWPYNNAAVLEYINTFELSDYFSGTFIWNDPDKSATPITADDITLSVEKVTENPENPTRDTFKITINLVNTADDDIADNIVWNESFEVVLNELPYTINDALFEGVPTVGKRASNTAYTFPATAKVKGKITLDNGAAGDDVVYDIIIGDVGSAKGAYISAADIAAIDTAEIGQYPVTVTIYDPGCNNVDDKFVKTGLYIEVVEAMPVEPISVTANTDAVVEIIYGSSVDDIKASIISANAMDKLGDLFWTVYTDDVARDIDDAAIEYTIDAADIEIADVGTAPGNYEATVTKVTQVADGTKITPASNKINVKVKTTSVTSIELETPWTEENEQPAGASFPGFGANKLVATFDELTSTALNRTKTYATIETTDALDVTNPDHVSAMTEDTVYINISSYKADTAGTYMLPVYVKDDAIGGAQHIGDLTLTVNNAIDTDNVVIVEDVQLTINIVTDEAVAKENAVALVESVFDGKALVKKVKTNDELGSVLTIADGSVTFTADDEITNNEILVSVTIGNGTYTFKNPLKNKIKVIMVTPPAINGAGFVNADTDADVIPSIKAAKAPYESDVAKLTMDWAAYKVKAAYPNPLNTTETLFDIYDYNDANNDGKGYTLTGWTDFKDGAETGEQSVTVTITDPTKAGSYVATLKAIITVSDEPSAYVKTKPSSSISLNYGTSEADALSAIYASTSLIQRIYKDGTAHDSTIKATAATITSYDGYLEDGTFNVTITDTDATDEIIENGAMTVTVKPEYENTPVAPGTIISNGGYSGGGGGGTTVKDPDKDDKDEEDDKEEQPDVTPGTTVGGDIPEGHYAAKAVGNLIELGIISGDQNGNVNLDATFTRAQMSKIAAFIHSALKGTEITADAADVSDGDSVPQWAEKYVAYVVDNGLITGHADGSFDANGNVSRAQLATILLRIYGYENGDFANLDKYIDITDTHWAAGALSKCVELGIMNGYGDSTIRPDNSVTTAEACVMIDRIMSIYDPTMTE